eukprot:CAMPEP_0115727188 /NCGR_PEP_ID=MMETSP0272-20121206/82292_1 /TAXON_ID=71861 /ORGANISM="Scrippsiella trochoidea, Strain CCMP3099" /LENGTH=72 /DNA_ID=CAMNT_0003170689 /DNA_START=20 /DNA_END=238 /DNA_ORIENTATION=-
MCRGEPWSNSTGMLAVPGRSMSKESMLSTSPAQARCRIEAWKPAFSCACRRDHSAALTWFGGRRARTGCGLV